jgi:aminopeptidase
VADPRVRELAELMVNRCLDVQPGWQVSSERRRWRARSSARSAGAIARRGAYYLPRINWGPERFRADLDWALEAPLELLGELPAIEAHQVANEDARLTIRAPEDVHAGAVLDPERRKLLQQAGEPASRRARALDVRWALVEYPTEAAAAEAGMSLPEFEAFVYDACLLDWDAEEERMREIKERFDRARSVHIVGDGTDLTSGSTGAKASSPPASATCPTARSSTARSRTRPRA